MTSYKRPSSSTLRFKFESKKVNNQSVKDLLVLENDSYLDISNVEIGNIISGFNKKFKDVAISNYLGAEFPLGLGVLFLGACKVSSNSKFINFSASAKEEKVVYSDASDTGGNILKIFYVNSASRYDLKNKELWSFTATKTFRSFASKYFKKNWNKCLRVIQKQDVSDFFEKEKKQKVKSSFRSKKKHLNYDDINIEL